MQLLDRIAEHAALQPDAVALRSGAQCLSYGELLGEVQRLAAQIEAGGFRRVGLQGDNSIRWVIFDLACLQVGIMNVPIPTFFTSTQREHIIGSAGLEAIFDADSDTWHALSRAEMAPVHAGTAKITFTSGSTGAPRGVCLSQCNLDATTRALAEALGPTGVRHHLCVLPLATLLENVAGVYLPLWLGAEAMLLPGADLGFMDGVRFDLFRFLQTLSERNPESLILVPQLLNALVLAGERGLPLPASLRFVAVGGGKVAPVLLTRAARLGLPVLQGYGLSECSSVLCLNTPESNRVGSVGHALSHARLRVGPDGMIQVQGESVMLGYLGDPAVDDAWLDTGDLGRIDEDGYLFVEGRAKNLIITSWGRNISPEWVESELLTEPAIAHVAVFGDDEDHLTAVVSPRQGFNPESCHDAVMRINSRLPAYARIGRLVVASSPFSSATGELTANGRVIRQRVEAHWLAADDGSPTTRFLFPQPAIAQEIAS